MKKIKAQMIAVPKALDVPRMQVVDLDTKSSKIWTKKNQSRVLMKNPLFTLTDLESVP